MEKEINEALEHIGPDDPRWDKIVQDFVDWYVQEWSRPAIQTVPFYADIDMVTGKSVTIVGQAEIDAYLVDKNLKISGS